MVFLNKNLHYILFVSALFFVVNTAKFPADDGFFYPQIANNIVHKHFFGFNDLYATNGFHPLWMVFAVIAEILNPLGKQFSLFILWSFQVTLIGFGYSFLEKSFLSDDLSKPICLTVVCLIFFSLGTIYLSEAHLVFFCLLLLLLYIYRRFENPFLFGFVASLTFLARLDLVFVLAPLFVYFFKENNWRRSTIFMAIVGFSILSVPYLLSNYYFFGDIVPISGKIKSSFPRPQTHVGFNLLTKFLALCTVSYIMLLFFVKNITSRNVKFYFVIGALLHLVYNLLFQSHLGQWYFVPQYIVVVFLLNDSISLINNHRERKQWEFFLTVCGFLTVVAVGWLKLTTSLSLQNISFDNISKFEAKQDDLIKVTAEQLGKIVPSNARIFTYDFPGKLAFYSDFNIIPADGLVGNKDFFNQISTNSFSDFLKKNNINYVLLPSYGNIPNEKNTFMALEMTGYQSRSKYYLKDALNDKIVDSTTINNMKKAATFQNPLKTWQPTYDSIRLYKP